MHFPLLEKLMQTMNPLWQDFLATRAPAFDTAASDTDARLMDLSHYGLLRITGADADTFLQGQFANDVREVSPQRVQLNAYCSPKGRVLAVFWLWQRDGDYWMLLPRTLVEATLKRLRLFVMRAQVTLEDVTDRYVAIGVAAPATAALWDTVGGLPEINATATQPDYTVLRLPGAPPRALIVGPTATLQMLWDTLQAHATPVSTTEWERLQIRAGLPMVYPETADEFVPQMLNLQAIGGVSFKKGCYPGQEIVARTQYLGALKRRMYLGHLPDGAPPTPGERLTVADTAVGRVVAAVPAARGGSEVLAVVEIAHAQAAIQCGAAPWVPGELPYSLLPEG